MQSKKQEVDYEIFESAASFNTSESKSKSESGSDNSEKTYQTLV